MKRDMDLVRQILLEVEKQPDPRQPADLKIEGYDEGTIYYHVMLLSEAGLVEAIDFSHMTAVVWRPQRLTWVGHEFLDDIRDPEIWRRTKEGAQKVGGFGLDVFGALAKGLIKQKVKEHTGVDLDL